MWDLSKAGSFGEDQALHRPGCSLPAHVMDHLTHKDCTADTHTHSKLITTPIRYIFINIIMNIGVTLLVIAIIFGNDWMEIYSDTRPTRTSQ